ncbi:MAG: tetratricopeptide repeat protein [Chlamydiae bacterium]|nr:tetratricopeptide repeat protein [Chlamydiota bacterium]
MFWNHSTSKSNYSKLLQTMGLSILVSSSLYAASPSSQEAFCLKRISEYWREGDVDIAKSQIIHFLEKYPESEATDSLHKMLGDLYLQEKNYEVALQQYMEIQEDEIQSKNIYNKAICLFETKRYTEVIEHTTRALAQPEPHKEYETLEFFLAESLLKKGLEQTDPEAKKSYLVAALPHYKHLIDSKHAKHALVPAAEISHILGHNSDACYYYGKILEKNPQERENLLFLIAELQEEEKPKDAIKTYSQVYKLRGKKAPEAAYNQLKILFKEERYKDLLLYQEEAMRHISETKLPIVNYWIGKSLFHLEDYPQATSFLMKTLSEGKLSLSDHKLLLKSLITCASKTKDADLLSGLIRNWEQTNPDDQELADVYLIQYQMLANSNKAGASIPLQKILEKFPSHKDKEAILFNLAHLQYCQKQWSLADSTFYELLKEYPESKYAAASWRFRINSKVEDLKSGAPETTRIKNEELADLISQVLQAKKILSPQEMAEYQYTYCKLLIQLNRQEESLEELFEYIENNPKSENLGEAYFLIAGAYSTLEEDNSLFITYAEKALATNLELKQKLTLHMNLFNTYLTLAEEALESEKEYLVSKAADHLFDAYDNGSRIKRDNLLWLSSFYYEKAKLEGTTKNKDASSSAKATILIEDLLGIHNYPPSNKLSEQHLSQEGEMLKLADLLGWQNKENEKIDVLEVLVYQQKNEPNLPWKYQRKALLDLARAYKIAGKTDDAIETYNYLISASEYAHSYIGNLALLERAKLKLSIINKEQDPSWQDVLNDLKDLELKKNLRSEPIHLEASLHYIECKTAHLPEDKKAQKTLQLLELMKETFSCSQDTKVKEYLSASSLFPEKAEIHANYMKLLDALIYLAKGEIAEKNKNAAEAKILFFQANQKLQDITDHASLPPDLLHRIRCNMEAAGKKL